MKEASIDLRNSSERTEWPGTQLLDGKATVYMFEVTAHFRTLFLAVGENLTSWLHPHLPEDPAFYRKDGSLLFGSISHEADAFLNLTEEELNLFEGILKEVEKSGSRTQSLQRGDTDGESFRLNR